MPVLLCLLFWRNRFGLWLLRAAELRAYAERSLREVETSDKFIALYAKVRDEKAKTDGAKTLRTARILRSHSRRFSVEVLSEMRAIKEDVFRHVLKDRIWIERVIQKVELKCYWFEVIECVRKAMLVGMTVLIQQGSYAQLIVGAVISTFMLTVVAHLLPYKHITDDLLALLCQLVVLLNLLLAMLLKGKQDETESRVLLSATEATDPIGAIAEARAELDDLERAVGIALLLLGSLPIPIALVLLAYDMRKEALLGYSPYDLWRPEVPLNHLLPEAAMRRSVARASLRERDKADADAARKMSLMVEAAKTAAKKASAEEPPEADASSTDAHPESDEDLVATADDGGATQIINVDRPSAGKSSTPSETAPPLNSSMSSMWANQHLRI